MRPKANGYELLPMLPPEATDAPEASANKSTAKRLDLQGLRTVAIAGVLCFHIWPGVFPNGYLGVDMFFVLSGYLMTQILTPKSPTQPMTRAAVKHFYSRRIQRIVPVYLLVLFLTLVAGTRLLLERDMNNLAKDVRWALSFTSNMENFFADRSYFAEVASMRLVLHTWSLSAEIQYYLFVPLLIFALSWVHARLPRARLPLVVLAAGASFALQHALALHYQQQELSFGLVFCRCWQFFTGSIVFYWRGKGNTRQGKETLSFASMLLHTSLLLLLAAILFAPHRLLFPLKELSQLGVIVLMALLVGWQSGGRSMLLSSRVAVELGDLSYVWYLVHWPLIQFVKYRLLVNSKVFGLPGERHVARRRQF